MRWLFRAPAVLESLQLARLRGEAAKAQADVLSALAIADGVLCSYDDGPPFDAGAVIHTWAHRAAQDLLITQSGGSYPKLEPKHFTKTPAPAACLAAGREVAQRIITDYSRYRNYARRQSGMSARGNWLGKLPKEIKPIPIELYREWLIAPLLEKAIEAAYPVP